MHAALAQTRTLAILGLLSGAVTWGLIWYPYRLLQQAGVSGSLATLVSYGLPLFAGILLFRQSPLRNAGRLWWLLALSAGWLNLGYVLAIIHGEVMRVLLLFYLAPLWTVILSRFLLGEQPGVHGYAIVGLSLAGAMLMLWRPGHGWPLPANTAEWIGLTAGLAFALTNVLSRFASGLSLQEKCNAVWVGVSLMCIPALLWQGQGLAPLAQLDAGGWGLLLGVALAIFIVTLTVQYGLAHLSANQAIVIFLSELVVAAFSSYFLANEALKANEWAGGVMIILASLFSGRLEQAEAARR